MLSGIIVAILPIPVAELSYWLYMHKERSIFNLCELGDQPTALALALQVDMAESNPGGNQLILKAPS